MLTNVIYQKCLYDRAVQSSAVQFSVVNYSAVHCSGIQPDQQKLNQTHLILVQTQISPSRITAKLLLEDGLLLREIEENKNQIIKRNNLFSLRYLQYYSFLARPNGQLFFLQSLHAQGVFVVLLSGDNDEHLNKLWDILSALLLCCLFANMNDTQLTPQCQSKSGAPL